MKSSTSKTVYLVILLVMPLILLIDLHLPVSAMLSSLAPNIAWTETDDKWADHCQGCSSDAHLDSNRTEHKFFLLEYDKAVQEIQTRLEHEHLLFVLKFTAAGAVIGLILQYYRRPVGEGGQRGQDRNVRADLVSWGSGVACWVAIAISAIIDVRAQFNAHMIGLVGSWVNCMELCVLPPDIVGWETFLSQSEAYGESLLLSALLRMDRQLLTWALYVVTVYVFVYAPHINGGTMNDESKGLLKIAERALPLCMIIFGLFGLYYYADIKYFNIAYVLIVGLLAFLSAFCVRRLSNTEETNL